MEEDLSLDEHLVLLEEKDVKKRIAAIESLEENVSSGNIAHSDVVKVYDAVVRSLKDNNFRIVMHSLRILTSLLESHPESLRSVVGVSLPLLLEKLGDSKEVVRQEALISVVATMKSHSPSHIFEKITSAANHKNWRIREHIPLVYSEILRQFGHEALDWKPAMRVFVMLLEDPQPDVRDTTMAALVEMRLAIGIRIEDELKKKDIRASQLKEFHGRVSAITEADEFDGTTDQGGVPDLMTLAEMDVDATGKTPKPQKHKVDSHSSRGTSSSTDSASGGGISEGQPSVASPEELSLEPIRLYSEKELSNEMKLLEDLLANTKANWKDRLHGIRKLQCLTLGNGPSYASFVTHIWDLRDALCAQLQDLRSAVVKEACSTVGTLAETLGAQFEAMADYLIPSLLKLTFVTIHVIAESGNSCLKKIVVASCPLRSIPKFVDGCSSRHNALRLRCIECIFLLLEIASQASLEKYTSMLERAIRGRVSDALAEARKVARLCFWAYAKHFPEGGRHLESSFSSNVRKHVEEEENTYKTMNIDELLSSSRVGWDGTSGASSFRRPASPFVASLESTSKGSSTPGIQREMSAPSAMTSTRKETEGPVARRASGVMRSFSSSTDRSGSSGHQHSSSITGTFASSSSSTSSSSSGSSRLALERVPSAPEVTVGSDANLGDSVGHLGGAKRVPRRDVAEDDDADMSWATNASSQDQQYPSARDRRKSDFVGIASKPGRIVATPKRRGSSSRDQESSDPPRDGVKKVRPASAVTSTPSSRMRVGMSSARKTPQTSSRRFTVSHAGDQTRVGAPLLDEKDLSGDSSTRGSPSQKAIGSLEELITMSQSHSWSTRVECFRQLGSIQHAAIRSHFERVIQVFLDHLGDPHFRVVVEDLQCLSDFVRNHADMVEHHMLRLFPKIFLKLSDPKESVRMAAGSALESLASVLAPASVLPVLLHISAAHKNPKIRLACLEFTIHVIPQGQDYFGSPENLHSALKRILPSTSDKNVDIRKASLAAMVALFKIDSDLFFEFLKSLAPERQKEVKKMMANSISSFGGSSSLPPTPSSKNPGSFSNGGPFSVPPPGTSDGRPAASYSSKKHKVFLDRLEKVDSERERPRTVDDTPKRSSHKDARVVDAKDITTEHVSRTPHQPDRRSRTRSESAAASFGGRPVLSPDVDVSVLLGQMSSAGEARKDALHQIIALSRTNTPSLWKGYFGQILLVVLETLKDDSAPHRELSLHCIREMLKNQTDYFDDFIEIVLARILEACHDESREVCQASDAAAEQFSLRIDPQKTLRVISPFILTSEGTTLQVSIKMLSRLVGRVSYGTLMDYIPQVLPGLFDAFKSPNADIRKAVVFCLVDIYMVLGDDFTPYLSELNTSQLKLVTIYINRITKAREEREKAMRVGQDSR
eukprot:TRINITY_DN13447_c0_g1_i1.p1 TRINITY_DN13447_c0_g1~~TRINITY_DN13447_c0_g1_i1.p1  ORF type:complete len:1399 (-),score=355.11 TRINITY_DN13447_c0_g1_i1:199-4395(-)